MNFPTLLDLGPEQRAVVDLPFDGNHVVTGSPGGGKTVMAVHRAWALEVVRPGGVTLLTYSNLLHQYLAQIAPGLTEAVRITTFHRWVRKFWREHLGADPPAIDEGGWRYDWTAMQRACLVQRIRSFEHLVIDEGQRLPIGFYRLCGILGIEVTVFADENQPIGDHHSTVPEISREFGAAIHPLVLSGNHRNSREIAALASEFHVRRQSDTDLPRRSGRTPALLRVPSVRDFLTEVSRYFEAHRDRSIGIICRSNHLLREVHSEFTRLGLAKHTQAYAHDDRHRNTMDFSNRNIRIVSAVGVKGLEFDSVFVPDLDAYAEDPTSVKARLRFLVLCTRAREDLVLAYRSTQEPAIISDIPEALLTRSTG
ncbi:DNA helicase [Kitasatospora sp. NPDC058162]|uniref:DNA helicase n=1 Tax=Kitasatospora sp. NPDC058162 TaxID=3346362 RepID=UPI0036D7AAFC